MENCRTRISLHQNRSRPGADRKEMANLSAELRDMLQALAEQAKRDRNLDLAGATETIFKQGGHPLDDLDNFFGVMQEVDHYIRCWRSDKLARALLPHTGKIIGGGWDYLSDQPRRAEILPPIPAFEVVHRIRAHRLIANSSPLWRDGIHERACMGLLAANVVLSDRTEKSDKILSALPNFVGFDWNEDLGDVVAKAWNCSGDQEDYYDETAKLLNEFLVTDQNNFTRPLEQAINNLRLKTTGLSI